MSYKRINWEDSPSTNTPLNAENLNHMDKALFEQDARIEENNKSIKDIDKVNEHMKNYVNVDDAEKQIGTYLGMNMYQKIYTVGSDVLGIVSAVNYPIDILELIDYREEDNTIGAICEISGFIKDGDVKYPLQFNSVIEGLEVRACAYIDEEQKLIRIGYSGLTSGVANKEVHVIVRYVRYEED
ncbi:MAG: hypothetical protein E7267_03925 [Lachnospiraceae bacterium]|nr:hypothetical protein [Lachnospiraceae bacterium]